MPALKAFLLAAGRGERLRPLTDARPKCLLPIGDRPLLQIWLAHLEKTGIDEVLINTHWLAEQVQDFVAQWSAVHHRMTIILVHEPVLLGSAGTILANRQWAGRGPFFIIYGDNLTRFDLLKMLRCHEESGKPVTIRVYRGADPARAGIVCLDENEVVIDFEEKPQKPKSGWGAGGIYIADSRIFAYYPKGRGAGTGTLDLSCHVLPRLHGNMQAYISSEFAMDIGTPESLAAARAKWREIEAGVPDPASPL